MKGGVLKIMCHSGCSCDRCLAAWKSLEAILLMAVLPMVCLHIATQLSVPPGENSGLGISNKPGLKVDPKMR